MDPSPEEITALADQVSQLAKSIAAATDPKEKKLQTQRLVLQAKQMIAQIQDPFDAIMDHVINAYTTASILALMEIGVFEGIPMHGSIHLKELAEKCNADESLITRLMRQTLCVGIFSSPQPDTFSHNRLSIGLSDHIGMTGKYFFEVAMDEMIPSSHRLNRYIQQYGRKDVSSYTTTPHSWYYEMVGKNFWEVLSSDGSGARLQRFSKGLSLFAALHPVVAIFPFSEALAQANSADRPLCVDIGGGRGLAMLELKSGCPELKGEVILQDRAVVLDDIPEKELPGVTKMTHDFFSEQPVKNSQVYYIRRVMHDWQDEDAARILKSVVPAMRKDSRILISDMCLPEPVGLQDAGAIWLDLMMLTIGGKERTHKDWEKLAELSGLKLVKVWQEPQKYGPLCVVEYVLRDKDELQTNGNNENRLQTNGIGMHIQGTKSELDLAGNVQTEPPRFDGEAGAASTAAPEELTGVEAEAKAYGKTEELSQQTSQTEHDAPIEVLTGDIHHVGIPEGMPVVSGVQDTTA